MRLFDMLRKALGFLLMSMGVSSPGAREPAARKPESKSNSEGAQL